MYVHVGRTRIVTCAVRRIPPSFPLAPSRLGAALISLVLLLAF
eukprot:COSAG01_NODE_33830_length_557_cov_13.307860_1_plen_42_part_10